MKILSILLILTSIVFAGHLPNRICKSEETNTSFILEHVSVGVFKIITAKNSIILSKVADFKYANTESTVLLTRILKGRSNIPETVTLSNIPLNATTLFSCLVIQ